MISADAFWGIIAVIVIQIIVIAFGYGKLSQKVNDLSKKIENGWSCKSHTSLCERISKLEGQETRQS